MNQITQSLKASGAGVKCFSMHFFLVPVGQKQCRLIGGQGYKRSIQLFSITQISAMNRPNLDDFTTLPQLLQFHLEHNADQTMYVYAQDENCGPLRKIKYLEFIRASHRAAHILRPRRVGQDRVVVAIDALLDSCTYTAVVAGLMQAGLIPLPISPRNTAAAVVNLLQKTNCHRLLVTNATLPEQLRNIKKELASSDHKVSFEEIPSLNELFPKLGCETLQDVFEPYPASKYPGSEDIATILHSSGSTGLPKPIPLSYDSLLKGWANSPIANQLGALNLRLGAHLLPTFHVMGFFAHLLYPIYQGLAVAIYPPLVTSPNALPLTPTPDNIIDHFQRTYTDSCIVIPTILQIWSQSGSTIEVLRSLKAVLIGGGPLPPATGDYLVSCGVKLRAVHGGTEFGCLAHWNWDVEGDGADWAWHRFPDTPNVRWMPQGDGTFELQCLNTDTYCVAVENLPDVKGYATSDLWIPHPTKPNLWSIIGRRDDVLIHSSGEKTVPGPFEEVVSRSPMVTGVVMFGRQRDQPGVLLELSAENQVDPTDKALAGTFRNKIWPLIEEANAIMPAFSRVYKEMILIASPSKPLPRAAKGTIMRQQAFNVYAKEIDEIYDSVQTHTDFIQPPSKWEISDVETWLKGQIEELCRNTVERTDDIFDRGFDSLCITILRLRIVAALRGSDHLAASRLILQNTLYNHPSIAKLAEFIVGLVDNPVENGTSDHVKAIMDMISRYSQGLDSAVVPCLDAPPSKTVVLLTGSTGNLGAQILALLLANHSIDTVYTLNRPSTRMSILQRHLERFQDKEFDCSLLSSEKLIHLEGNTSQPKLGLTDDVYEEIQRTLTVVIHNAWRLDFNLVLSSFEPHVRGTRNLIDLARSSRHASTLPFLFTSSIGAAQSWDSKSLGPYPEKVVLDPRYAVGFGYGESKYVSERILGQSGLRASSFRIGQITGSSPSGAWAMTDWVPSIIKTSLVLGVLPDAEGTVSWAPMDAIAQAIIDVALTKEEDALPLAINLVHPRPVHWTTVMEAIRASLISCKQLPPEALPLVPFHEWVVALDEDSSSSSSSSLSSNRRMKCLL
ncbi:hypothetical protein D9757_000930 [Collybiopsis confluens]|uniref:Acetyl-CoA synthetase-like protein n=1 Tax=Collybiopsis confluens TaxID=2823264 RepID=A0A8H5HZW9_9AGAR|nr:hypothetical protein D9757_000930 [Collybiopsis confluens]